MRDVQFGAVQFMEFGGRVFQAAKQFNEKLREASLNQSVWSEAEELS
jgi:hypothetical protein